MFNWWKRDNPPDTCDANPGKHVKLTAAFTNGVKTWEEQADVVLCMSEALEACGRSHTSQQTWLELDDRFVVLQAKQR